MLYVRISRSGIVSIGNDFVREILPNDFRGQNTEAPPLPFSSRFSQFGTVSVWAHLQGLSPLSRLSFSSSRFLVFRKSPVRTTDRCSHRLALSDTFVSIAELGHKSDSACRQAGNSPRKPRLNEHAVLTV